jgi:hypothetical protein
MSLRRFIAPLSILFFLFAIPAALATGGGYGDDPCDEYHETRHPECQTTTTYQGSTTTTEQGSTTTQPEVTTTAPFVEQTTTTVQECADGLVHVPPFCVSPKVEVSSTMVTASAVPVTTQAETLPFTGLSSSFLALASSLFLAAGVVLLALRRRGEG